MSRRAGFSLIELMVVLSVALILTGLMLPALSQVRENAFRVVCASNQRQLGMGMFMYAGDHDEQLPKSSFLDHERRPQELMIAYRNEPVPSVVVGGETFVAWDGVGRLFQEGYCSDPGCFYCPSHTGEHTLDRYQAMWRVESPAGKIYTNFHYAGHRDWSANGPVRSLDRGERLVLLTDGLRTKQDFNHRVGANMLVGDGSVTWREDHIGLYDSLPDVALATASDPNAYHDYLNLWNRIEQVAHNR